MSKQPEAVRLADELDAYHTRSCHKEAAAELRRLHALNGELLEALKELASEEWRDDDDPILDRARIKARQAIAKAEAA